MNKKTVSKMQILRYKKTENGKGRVLDNIFMERTFRSLKYDEVYLNEYDNVNECRRSIESFFRFFNQERIHQSLDHKTFES